MMRRVRDVYLTLSVTPRVSFKIFMVLSLLATGGLIWEAQSVSGPALVADGILAFGLALALSLLAGLVIFINYSRGVVIDAEGISFPASDVENSVLALLLGKSLWGHLFRERLPLDAVEDIQLDWSGAYWSLNLIGTFGSRQLDFSSKQKCDECWTVLRSFREVTGNRAIAILDYSE